LIPEDLSEGGRILIITGYDEIIPPVLDLHKLPALLQ
jgi:hypothetical protein